MGRIELVNRIIDAKYYKYTEQVIEKIQDLGPEFCLSGDESGLDDVWEEFKT